MDLKELLDSYYPWINKANFSPLHIETVMTHVDKIAVFITDKSGVTLMYEDELPPEHDEFNEKIKKVWDEIHDLKGILEVRGYAVNVPYEGKIKGMDYLGG